MSDRLAVLAQYLLPKQAITVLAGKLAGLHGGRATTAVIRWFIRRYGVNMAEAANPEPASYPSFNAFFTRPLNAHARPLADADVVSPVDGAISQLGPIAGDQIFQAKGHSYSVAALLGGDRGLAADFTDGQFATFLRRGEAEYKQSGLGRDSSEQDIVAAMARYPKLIERPIVVKGKRAVLGRPPENVLELIN